MAQSDDEAEVERQRKHNEDAALAERRERDYRREWAAFWLIVPVGCGWLLSPLVDAIWTNTDIDHEWAQTLTQVGGGFVATVIAVAWGAGIAVRHAERDRRLSLRPHAVLELRKAMRIARDGVASVYHQVAPLGYEGRIPSDRELRPAMLSIAHELAQALTWHAENVNAPEIIEEIQQCWRWMFSATDPPMSHLIPDLNTDEGKDWLNAWWSTKYVERIIVPLGLLSEKLDKLPR